ncbi:unnamed protein product [Closterium sp. NIES-54]
MNFCPYRARRRVNFPALPAHACPANATHALPHPAPARLSCAARERLPCALPATRTRASPALPYALPCTVCAHLACAAAAAKLLLPLASSVPCPTVGCCAAAAACAASTAALLLLLCCCCRQAAAAAWLLLPPELLLPPTLLLPPALLLPPVLLLLRCCCCSAPAARLLLPPELLLPPALLLPSVLLLPPVLLLLRCCCCSAAVLLLLLCCCCHLCCCCCRLRCCYRSAAAAARLLLPPELLLPPALLLPPVLGLHLYLHCVTRDDDSLFEHTSGSLQAPKAPAEPAADAGEEVQTQFRTAHIAYKRWMARDAAATLAVRLHLSFDQRANFRQVPSAHAMYSAVVMLVGVIDVTTPDCRVPSILRRVLSDPDVLPPPLIADWCRLMYRCLVLPITFPALSDLIIVANEGGRSGAGGSGGGGHQELEPSCVAACAPTSTVYAHPSTVLSCLVVPSASSGSTKGGDPTAADTATSRRSPRLETPQGFPPRMSSPPLQPVAADFGGPGVVGGGDAGVLVLRVLPLGVLGVLLSVELEVMALEVLGLGKPAVLPLPPPSSLPAVPDPVSDLARAAHPTIPCCLAALVTAPASSSPGACALVAELAGFGTTCRRAYLAGLVSASSCPPSVGGELALGCDVLEDRQFELEYLLYPLSIRTCYVALGRHHPTHWQVARRVLRYLVRLASIT